MATLTILAVPVYQHHTLRSNRMLAKAVLADLSVQQEAYALHHNRYANDLGALLGSDQVNATSFHINREGKKTRAIDGNGSSIYAIELLNATATSFDLKATAEGVQARDQECQSLSLNSRGQRRAVAREGADPSNCWR